MFYSVCLEVFVAIARFLALLVAFYTTTSLSAAINQNVTQDIIQQTICVPGYTKTIRPPVSQTNKIKRDMMEQQGIDSAVRPYIALDHIIPMALGGHPSDLENFQLISHRENARKSRIEVKLQCLVCTGQISLSEAQKAMNNWQSAYHQYAKVKCKR